MSKKATISSMFKENDTVVVIDPDHKYTGRAGIVERLGSAGDEVTYIHARLDGIGTVIAFREFQVQKVG